MPNLLDAYRLLHDGAIALSTVEQAGIRIDVDYCREKLEWLDEQMMRCDRRLRSSELGVAWTKRFGTDTSFGSGLQLQAVLYADLNVKAFKQTESGQDGVDEESLKQTNVDGIPHLLRQRSLKKVKDVLGQFLRYQIDGYLYPNFNLHTVVTYRSSSSEINCQNIPKRDKWQMDVCRRAIVPSPGNVILEIDFKAIEVAIAACVTGDTKIATPGRARSVLEIIDDLSVGKDVYVYGYDLSEGRIGLSRVNAAGITRRSAEIWKVTLDNGETIRATPDHMFMLRTGEYARLDALYPGVSLMPLYRKIKKGGGRKTDKRTVYYRDVYLNNGEHIWEHNLIALDLFGVCIKGSNLLVHHGDGNGCNNDLSNLEIMTRSAHMRLHSIQGWDNNRDGHVQNHWSKTDDGRRFISEMNAHRMASLTEVERMEMGRRVSEGIRRNGGRAGERNSMYGRTHSEATLFKISESRRANPTGSWCAGLTKETDARLARAGEKLSATKRANPTPAWNKGATGLYVTSEETKQKLSNAMMGREVSATTRALLRDSRLQYWKQRKHKKIECKLCGGVFTTITNTHLRYKHGITIDEYQSLTDNHKVLSIEHCGYEDVYNLDVAGLHNYAVSAGVILKNCYHKDPTMLAYLRDPASDMHADQAIELFFLRGKNADLKKVDGFGTLRQSAKNGFIFPEFYGDYYESCAQNIACGWLKLPRLGDWTDDDGETFDGQPVAGLLRRNNILGLPDFTEHVKKVEDRFWNVRFPVYSQWKKDWYFRYQRRGSFQMKTGFVCSGVMARNAAVNYPIQGSAFHVLLKTLILMVERTRGWASKIIGEIHDSGLIDAVPAEVPALVGMAQHIASVEMPQIWPWINAPLSVESAVSEVDGSWAHMTEIK